MYNSPLADLIRSFGVEVHLYADDSQLYLAFEPESSEVKALNKMEQCIDHVRRWMASNFLKLNDDKTEFVILGSKQQLRKVSTETLKVGDVNIHHVDSARNIGAWFDNTFKLEQQAINTCKAAWYHIRNIGKIRKHLSAKHATTLIHAFVTTKLDQNNSLLFGSSKILTKRLQKVQNAAAKLITKNKKYDNVTPILQELHWLPIEQRIVYKIALLVYKSLHGCGPEYLSELLHVYKPIRNLRSSDQLSLVIPKTKLSYGERAFSYAGPTVWNMLPFDVTQSKSLDIFKKKLKTHLYSLAYQ